MPKKIGGKKANGTRRAELQPSAQTLAALDDLAQEWNCSKSKALERSIYHAKCSIAHAYHEAGHAVIALEFGLEIKSIEITKVSSEHPSILHPHLQLMLAGMVAQRKAGVSEIYVGLSGKLDQEKCERIIAEEGLSKRQGKAEIDSARKAVEELFERPSIWRAVKRIAALLFEFCVVSPVEAQKIFEEERTRRCAIPETPRTVEQEIDFRADLLLKALKLRDELSKNNKDEALRGKIEKALDSAAGTRPDYSQLQSLFSAEISALRR